MYELDEGLLAPDGSQVQCTKCEHVFVAFPPSSAGRTLVGVPAAPERTPVGDDDVPPPPPSFVPQSSAGARAGPGRISQPRAPDAPRQPVPAHGVPAPVYRPAATSGSAAPPVPRAPILKRDTVGAFEARLRWSARLRWLVPAAIAAVLVVVGAAWFLLSRRLDPTAVRLRADAVALVAQDDAASLETAEGMLEDAGRRERRLAVDAAADAAMAGALRGAAPEDGGAGATPLADAAAERLGALQRAHATDTAVLRAVAVSAALGGDRERAGQAVVAARERAPDDPWVALAEATVDARSPDKAARERALARLGTIVASRPDMLRARFLLARAQAEHGRKSEAVATLDGLLAVNPHHEAARSLRGELAAIQTSPPPAAHAAAVVPGVPNAPAPAPGAQGKHGLLPRNPAAQPVDRSPLPVAMQPIPVAPPPGVPSGAGAQPGATPSPRATQPGSGVGGAPGNAATPRPASKAPAAAQAPDDG